MTDTPVTKLDSVERLKLAAEELFMKLCTCDCEDCRAIDMPIIVTALTEARREALREAARVARSYKMGRDLPIPAANVDLGFETLARDLERLAVEEGTK
jgi:hypothetical protein